jgi:hypothetical protein
MIIFRKTFERGISAFLVSICQAYFLWVAVNLFVKRDEIVEIWSSRLAISRLSCLEEIIRFERVGGAGEAMDVTVDAGVDGTNEDSGLVMNPSLSAPSVMTKRCGCTTGSICSMWKYLHLK